MSKKISEMPAKTGPMVTADEFTILDSADANPATKNKKIARELALGSRQPVAPIGNQLGVAGGWTPAGTAAEADIGSGDADVVVNSVLAADFAAHNASGAAHSGNLPTATEKAALAGDGGTPPGAANPYATMDDLSGVGGAVSSVEGVSTVENVGLTVGDVQLQLVNDDAAPGGKQVYGTDNLGNKGWYDAAAVDSIDGRNSIYSVSGNTVGNVVLELDGDAATPGANQVYGTDGAGDKGWKPDPAGGGGGVSVVGTPTPNQAAIWDSATAIRGVSPFGESFPVGSDFNGGVIPDGTRFYHQTRKVEYQYEQGWIAKQSFAPLTLYVDPVNGADDSLLGFGSGANAAKSLSYLWNNIVPGSIGGDIKILIAAGTISEDVTLGGKNYYRTLPGHYRRGCFRCQLSHNIWRSCCCGDGRRRYRCKISIDE